MSPIGNVFIVLNLIGAGFFVGFTGSYLQKQDNYKQKYEQSEAERTKSNREKDAQIVELGQERNKFENAKTSAETLLGEANNKVLKLQDENKRLIEDNRSQGVALASIMNDMKAMRDEDKAQSDRADAMARENAKYLADKNEAVNERVAAVIAKEELLRTKAALEATIAKLEDDKKSLTKDNSELNLLVKAAEQHGFLVSMAAPALAGQVTVVNNNLCTIQISENTGGVDIQDQISKGNWSFAIYDDKSGYKGEAVAKEYNADANAVFCTIRLVKGTIQPGDKAKTKLF
ncbi:MAG: hypothetical protein JNL12_23195 [Planctomycetes bacterium]|nr:hypothetical protein [Planctomycetota bacterium]